MVEELGIFKYFRNMKVKNIDEKRKLHSDLTIKINKLNIELNKVDKIRNSIIVDIRLLKKKRDKLYLGIKPYIT